jgi:hypothetical protein
MKSDRKARAVSGRVVACLVVSTVFLVLAGAAFGAGGSSATDQYGGSGPVSDVLAENAAAPTNTLPFTGLSLIGAVALGAGLVGVGIVLRRRTAGDES